MQLDEELFRGVTAGWGTVVETEMLEGGLHVKITQEGFEGEDVVVMHIDVFRALQAKLRVH